ncbi:MAG: hypothetical protein FJ387_03260 [Verrucomicrobia bacterium]|nr:hypothetical protein [Verrucomicrobiota bacterium]
MRTPDRTPRIARRALRLTLAGLAFIGTLHLAAWEGHDWHRWWQVTTWTKPELTTRQSGQHELLPLLANEEGGSAAIRSVRNWEKRRAELRAAIGQVLGQPNGLTAPPPEARVLGEEELADHVRRRIEVRAEADDWIPAFLLLPKPLPTGPTPAMICLHQTVSQGKAEPCGIEGDPELAFALELVRRGYVCIAPDAIGFGDRIPPGQQPYHDSLRFYRRHSGWSFFGKMIWDVSRVIDYLQTLPFIDAQRIGSIGHSHGAYGTLFAAAFEPRLALAIASCGFTPFRTDPTPERWSHATALLPQLGLYLPAVQDIPFDWQEICALVAPRPLFVWYASQDAIFPGSDSLEGLLQDVRSVYGLYGATNALAWQRFDGPHRFPRAGRQSAYGWLVERWGDPREDPHSATSAPARKQASAFFPPEVVARAQANCRQHDWAATARERLVAAAAPWLERSDDDLWGLMFGPTIRRSWMVWSNGHCPACRKPVPMYEWRIDALAQPWKVQCPQCQELFPKNDFAALYRSGLDDHGVFDPTRADRQLLFNLEHPQPSDPQHQFGVDDGEGYVAGGQRWRFVGTYLIYGQWKQAIVGGIRHLAAAYVVTGNPAYAHKAGVLLDRVADLYPTFDFGKQGVLYEGPARAGYVSTWHDACVEALDLALAYDAVFPALAQDAALVQFLAAKAAQHQLPRPKSTWAHIQQNIEERLLADTLEHRPKIESNYPSTDVTLATIETVQGWPANRAQVQAHLDRIITRATAVDGLTGEKGLTGYSTIAPRALLDLLGRYARCDPAFLKETLARHPRLRAMYRFHLETRCLNQYYPHSGDAGAFAEKTAGYPALSFSRTPTLQPSAYSFLWDLYLATSDLDFVRLLYAANDSTAAGLPHDLFCDDPAALQQRIAQLIAQHGSAIAVKSVHFTEWCLAILRSGEGAQARALWLDYDSGGGHGHADGMNLGLFAHGLDLLPDLGYPPVQYGGWSAPRALWYTQTAAHNTVQVDGRNLRPAKGRARLWFPGQQCQLMQAEGSDLVPSDTYTRTVALVDVSAADAYVLDLFHVVGGQEHTKFLHSHFGRITTRNLTLEPAENPRFGELMRHFRRDPQPTVPWTANWEIEDRLKCLPTPKAVQLRYTDLTSGAEVQAAEGWVAVGMFGGTAEAWVPRLLVSRRTSQPPLASTFIGVLEPHAGQPIVASARRLPLRDATGAPAPESHVGLELCLADGRRDLWFVTEPAAPNPRAASPPQPFQHNLPLTEPETGLEFEGALSMIRLGPNRQPERIVLVHARSLRGLDLQIRLRDAQAAVELCWDAHSVHVVAGAPEAIDQIQSGGLRRWPK